MHRIVVSVLTVLMLAALAHAQPATRKLELDDVVFMYAASDAQAYRNYSATFLAWGGAHSKDRVQQLRELGVYPTATMWCLTAGAKRLHENAEVREAVVRDIEGKPIAVPWLFDHTHQGTPSWWGCTNNPTYRALLRDDVRKVMSGGADGLHVDDHLGSAAPSEYAGGCFCDHCMAAFAKWLRQHSSAELLKKAGVESFEGFDFRAIVRKHATRREDYLKVRHKIPLYQEFIDCQLQLAAQNIRELGQVAAEVAGRPVTLSANTCLPGLSHVVVTPYLTHLVGEVGQHAKAGTSELLNAVRAYRMAETINRPIAATASGWDWAYVKEHRSENLVRIWIALSYACGQRLMTPHHVWCFTSEKGTHWYDGPKDAYTPLYRFVRTNPDLFRGYRTVGPLAPPRDVPQSFETLAQRKALQAALDLGNPRPMQAGDQVWVFPRAGADGSLAVHLINLDYQPADDRLTPQKAVVVRLPAQLAGKKPAEAVLHSYDAAPLKLDLANDGQEIRVTVPELRTWAIVKLR